MHRIACAVEEELYDWLEGYRAERKLSKSQALRRILTVYKLALQKRLEREAEETKEITGMAVAAEE